MKRTKSIFALACVMAVLAQATTPLMLSRCMYASNNVLDDYQFYVVGAKDVKTINNNGNTTLEKGWWAIVAQGEPGQESPDRNGSWGSGGNGGLVRGMFQMSAAGTVTVEVHVGRGNRGDSDTGYGGGATLVYRGTGRPAKDNANWICIVGGGGGGGDESGGWGGPGGVITAPSDTHEDSTNKGGGGSGYGNGGTFLAGGSGYNGWTDDCGGGGSGYKGGEGGGSGAVGGGRGGSSKVYSMYAVPANTGSFNYATTVINSLSQQGQGSYNGTQQVKFVYLGEIDPRTYASGSW